MAVNVKQLGSLFVLLAITSFMVGVIAYVFESGDLIRADGDDQPEIPPPCLYPRESETREVKSLDGMWNFVQSNASSPDEGIDDKWYLNDLDQRSNVIDMPVPSSYNDVTEDRWLRDHVGTVWYDRKYFVPQSWSDSNKIVFLRFGGVHYKTIVWVNGKEVLQHEIGHLPFQADITSVLEFGKENRITVMVDNILLQTTLPQGSISYQASDVGTQIVQSHTMDFFNYAGIQRSVYLYTTPKTHIEDVYVTSEIIGTTGRLNFEIEASAANPNSIMAVVNVKDKEGNVVGTKSTSWILSGFVDIPNANLWWPYLMHPEPGYLYTFEVQLQTTSGEIVDVYRLEVGIRVLKWDNKQFYINDKPIYFRGFGRHEDADVRGKGLDLPLLAKDFNLIEWIGANAYRTSHYPYSEESMEMADRHGIMVVDESPAANVENFSPTLMAKHKLAIHKLIRRDRNHPSAIMWSMANEPRSNTNNADTYFSEISRYTRSLDSHRPITAAIHITMNDDKVAQFLDIVSFNRYNGWYIDSGKIDMMTKKMIDEATNWHNRYNKPVLVSEYGADTLEGLHLEPSYVWSEEWQTDVCARHFEAFDVLRNKGFFIGEFIWNFIDFKTEQNERRVGGNKKGIFTRQRQPKAAAHLIRKRYHSLAEKIDNVAPVPEDVFQYVIED